MLYDNPMKKDQKPECFACKKRSDIFDALSDDDLEKISCSKVSVRFKQGEVLFKSGTPIHNVFCLTQGLVKLIVEDENELGVITSLITPVNYIFDPGMLQERRHQLTAIALVPTSTCIIDIQLFLNMVATNSAFAFAFIRHISQQFSALHERINIHSKRHVYGRIANLLLTLRKEVYQANAFEVNLSRQDIADLSRMTKESAIRVLKKFKEDGIISLEGNYIEIHDLARLEEIGQKG